MLKETTLNIMGPVLLEQYEQKARNKCRSATITWPELAPDNIAHHLTTSRNGQFADALDLRYNMASGVIFPGAMFLSLTIGERGRGLEEKGWVLGDLGVRV